MTGKVLFSESSDISDLALNDMIMIRGRDHVGRERRHLLSMTDTVFT